VGGASCILLQFPKPRKMETTYMLDPRILYNHSCKTLYQDLDNELTQIMTGLKADCKQIYRIASIIDKETRVFSRLQAHHCIRYCQ
jgi:hypothetical protein